MKCKDTTFYVTIATSFPNNFYNLLFDYTL